MQWSGAILVALIIGWLFFGWFKPAPVYTAYFYYDTSDLDKYWTQTGLADLDACRSWVNSQIIRDVDGEYDYECGKNCRYEDKYRSSICETTER